MKGIAILSFILLAAVQTATAQTESIPFTSGPCVAQLIPGLHGSEWTISASYQLIFTESQLVGPPFRRPGGGVPTIASDFFHRDPVFGCTQDTLYLATFHGSVVTVTAKNFLTNTPWTLQFTSETRFGENKGFPAPDGLAGTVTFITATAFVTQGNRIVMLGDFANGPRKSSRAYELSDGKKHLFNFAGLEASSITNTCITVTTLWFTVRVGTFQELFEIDARGNLILIATLSAGGTLGFSCGAGGAQFGIQAAGTLREIRDLEGR